MSIRLNRNHLPLGASYTIVPSRDKQDRSGTIYTNRDAVGPITITLPTPTRYLLGWEYRVRTVVDQNITVQAPVANTLIAFNGNNFTSLSAQTAGQRIGAQMEFQCVELSPGVYRWAALGDAVGHTYTVA